MSRIGNGLLAVTAIGALLAILQSLKPPRYSYFWDNAFDTGHILIFGLVTVVLLRTTGKMYPTWPQFARYALSMAGGLALGLAVEVWQAFDRERTFELIDLFFDLVGVVVFSCFHAAWDRGGTVPPFRAPPRRGMLIAGVVVLGCGLLPLAQVCLRYRARDRLFPVLIDFSGTWYRKLCYAQSANWRAVPPPSDWPRSAVRTDVVARLDLKPSRYPGFFYREPYPDWRGYRALECDLYLDDDTPRTFVVRVHDRQHDQQHQDRFNQVVTARPGLQTFRFELESIRTAPAGRDMDLSRVASLAVFTVDLDKPLTVYLGSIRLVP